MHRPIPCPTRGLLSALTLSLVIASAPLRAGAPAPPPAPAAGAKAMQAQQAANQVRAGQGQVAMAHLLAQRSQLGLGDKDTFLPTRAFTTQQGKGVVRLKHFHEGHRVWGSEAIVHLPAGGPPQTLARGVQTNVALTGAPALGADQAIAIALQRLVPQDRASAAPQAELVVFPSSRTEAHTYDTHTGGPAQHPTVLAQANLSRPYVWAYEVRTHTANKGEAPKALTYIIEGDSGVVLRAWDAVVAQQAAPNPGPVVTGPAKGTGKGFYRGDVSLDVSQLADGTYAIYDPTRGSNALNPNPVIPLFAIWPDWQHYPDPNVFLTSYAYWTGWRYDTGFIVMPQVMEPGGWDYGWDQPIFGQATPAWGDGQQWAGHWLNQQYLHGGWDGAWGPNGQTTVVDTLKTLQDSYDFYQKVLGWTGWDGQDCGIWAGTIFGGMDNAYWDPTWLGITIGGGSYPDNPGGFSSMSDLDVVSHEYSHAVSDLVHFYDAVGTEEGGLDEGNSDIFAQMISAWALRPAGAPDTEVPTTGANWTIGGGVNHGTPFRWMDKPSKDGISPDGWFYGLLFMDPHYQMGVVSRFFYFLSQGATATAGDHHSAFLPSGMTGIGNDQATRIWFNVITTRMTGGVSSSPGANYGITLEDARADCLIAAQELYGVNTIQTQAVENAWAAVNVGQAHGQPMRTQVRFDDWRDPAKDYLAQWPWMRNTDILPAEEPVFPHVTVLNNANTAVTWSLGDPGIYHGVDSERVGGRVNADGSYSAPAGSIEWVFYYNLGYEDMAPGWYHLTATSQADPTQFGSWPVYVINTDLDGDGERDALDMSGLAFSWWLSGLANTQHNIWVDVPANQVSHGDVAVGYFVDACKNAWRVK